MSERLTGFVNYVNLEKGFGFIRPDKGESDLFFHVTYLPENTPFDAYLNQRDVSFELMEDPEGRRPRAVKIEILR